MRLWRDFEDTVFAILEVLEPILALIAIVAFFVMVYFVTPVIYHNLTNTPVKECSK